MQNKNKFLIISVILLFGVGLLFVLNTSTPKDLNKIETDTVKNENMISMQEVTMHMEPTDCWMVLDGKVYDVSNFGEKHAGGKAVYEACGKDGTVLFNTRPMGTGTPHSDKARLFLPKFYIGDLSE